MSPPAMTGRDAAEVVGCCRAPNKQACIRPPCPCNLDTYTRAELFNLRLTPGDGRARIAEPDHEATR